MKIYMIRHGATKGNILHRYVGSTDEELLPESREQLTGRKMPSVDRVYVSPLLRCRQTAYILYPGQKQTIVEGFSECDFGDFEYLGYEQLNGNSDYQRFIETEGQVGFPGGEDRASFQRRCEAAFLPVLEAIPENMTIALVVHGGTIMALLDALADSSKTYYDWQVGNGEGFVMEAVKNGDVWKLIHIEDLEMPFADS